MSTRSFNTEIDDDEIGRTIKVSISYVAVPYVPARIERDPDDSYPEEGGGIEDVSFNVLDVIFEGGMSENGLRLTTCWSIIAEFIGRELASRYEHDVNSFRTTVQQWCREDLEARSERDE